MILAVVKGNVVSTNKTEKLHGSKLMIVEEWNIDTGKPIGQPKVALDIVGAGEGELVLCVSGSSARQTVQTAERPVDMAIIGIVDQVEMNGSTKYKKFDHSFDKPETVEKTSEVAPEAEGSGAKNETLPLAAEKAPEVAPEAECGGVKNEDPPLAAEKAPEVEYEEQGSVVKNETIPFTAIKASKTPKAKGGMRSMFTKKDAK